MPPLIGNLLPWDLGAAFDNLLYQGLRGLADLLWAPHAILNAIAYFLGLLARSLTERLLPILLQILISYLQETGLFRSMFELALLLLVVSLVAAYAKIRVVEMRKLFWYGVLVSLMFTQGPSVMASIEGFRRQTARGIYDRTYSAMHSEFDYGGLPAPAPWAQFTLYDYQGDGYSASDVALSALLVSGGQEILSGGLPSRFHAEFFPQPGISALNEAARNAALERANDGLKRLALCYPLSAAAVWETIVDLLFSVAGAFLLLLLPIALLFSFFLPTEGIVLGIMREYLTLVIRYIVVSVLIALGMAALVSAAGRGSLPVVLGASAIAWLMFLYGVRAAKDAVSTAFTSLSTSVSTTLGVRDPVSETLEQVQRVPGTVMGLAGAGLAVAAGAPMLAPTAFSAGQGLASGEAHSQQGEQLKTIARVSAGLLGGHLMQGTPVAGVATAVSAWQSFSAAGAVQTLGQTTAADATLAGLQSRNPTGMILALDRSAQRQERAARTEAANNPAAYQPPRSAQRQEHAAHTETANNPAGYQPHGYQPHGYQPHGYQPHGYQPQYRSPWRGQIDKGLETYGEKWGDQIAAAITRAVETLRQQDPHRAPEDLARQFVDAQGRPSLVSPGGKLVYDQLPPVARAALKDKDAQAAAAGMIGEAVFPQREISRAALADAIAQAVEAGVKGGAEAAARRLGVGSAALGSAYGPANTIVRLAQDLQLNGAETRAVVLKGEMRGELRADPRAVLLQQQAQLLPEQLQATPRKLHVSGGPDDEVTLPEAL